MTKANNYLLKTEELSQIQDAIRKDKRVEVVKRATALRLLHKGYKPDAVAEMLGVNSSSIYNWRKRWREGNLESRSNRPIGGRPQKATEAYGQELEAILAQNPRDLGYLFSIWTTERLGQHLAESTGIDLSAERLRVLMLSKGYVYRRPRADLSIQQDAEARAEAETVIEDLKKSQSRGF